MPRAEQTITQRFGRWPRAGAAPLVAYGAVAALLVAFLVPHLAARLRFEDALIVLRYARNLLAGEGFVFNPGERVLGVTTPLHTLISVLWIPFGREGAATAQNVFGLLFLALEGGAVVVLLRRLGQPWLGVVAGLLVIANLNLSYLYAGMEVHPFGFLILAAFLLHLDRREAATGLVLGVAFLVRYDAALMAGLVGLWRLIETRRWPVRLTAAFFATVLPWLLFAQLYFGSILPHALGAKEGFAGFGDYATFVFFTMKETFKTLAGLYLPNELLRAGLSYLYPLALVLGAGSWFRREPRTAILAVYSLLHVATYAAIGSDPQFTWHYAILNPIWLPLAVSGAHAAVFAPLARWLSARWLRRLEIAAFAVVLAPLLVHLARQAGHVYQPDPHTRQLATIGVWLREHYPPETSLLQPSIGILGWESGLRMIDHAGLVTPGLYYFHEGRSTPRGEVLDTFAPDLVLLTGGASAEDVEARGYRVVKTFSEPDYVLWEASARLLSPESSSPQPPSP